MEGKTQLLVIGIGGNLLGIDPATGAEVWRARLKGSDIVTVSSVGGRIFAGASGELFCLDAVSGQMIWHNKLKGLGTGIVSFGSAGEIVAISAHEAKKRAAAATTAAAVAT